MTTSHVPHELAIPVDGIDLGATSWIPHDPIGLIVFVHGTGSSRTSPRNRRVAAGLHDRGFAALLVDFMTAREAEHEALDLTLRSDTDVIADRLVAVTDWIGAQPELRGLPVVYFGASTGAASALIAAARRPAAVAAIVSRGGRVDLAGEALAAVRAPTLLLVGAEDASVLASNQDALGRMQAPAKLEIVPRADHLFAERGTLDEVARRTGDWLVERLRPAGAERLRPASGAPIQFEDRRQAGRELGRALLHLAGPHALVIALPRGGVLVGDEVARALAAPLEVWIVRTLGVPHQPELAMGALAEGATLVLDRELVRWLDVTPAQVLEVVHREAAEIRRGVDRFRDGRAAPDVRGRTAILVDDGIGSGRTIGAAARAVRRRGAARVVIAAPVGAPDAIAGLHGEADEIVCLSTPARLGAIGTWYQDFRHVSDAEVLRTLAEARTRPQLEGGEPAAPGVRSGP